MTDETRPDCCEPDCCEPGCCEPGCCEGQASAGAARVPEACTLPQADRPGRVAEFAELFSRSVRAARRTGPTRLHLDLEPGPETAARAAGLAAAESQCCSFFTFTLTAAGGTLSLDVTVPDTQVPALDMLAQPAASSR